jgi:prolyl-tRNA synthetase
MGAFYTDSAGVKKPLWLASYGIGPTRLLGTLVEMFHDDKGIVWSKNVAPYQVHLISLRKETQADEIYQKLQDAGVEVLYDDRDVAPGQKFSDSDLIGIPVRLVVSEKTADKIEYKKRNEENSQIIELEEVLKKLK